MASKMRVKVTMFSVGAVDVEIDGDEVYVTPVNVAPLVTDTTTVGPELPPEQQNLLMLYACERVLAEVHQAITKRLEKDHKGEVITPNAPGGASA